MSGARMMNTIFDKTDKGRDEIATRQYHLAPRLRTLLLLVDGKHTAGELLAKIASLGVTEASIAELLDNGFICAASVATVASIPSAAQVSPTSAPQPVEQQAAATVLPEGKSQFEAIYEFYTATIKSTIGLRGYALQLKVEKSASIDDFRQLRRPYLEAVLKARGEEMARSLRDRLDQLLNADGSGGRSDDMGNTEFAAGLPE
jgi:hypothetical protein